MPRQWLPRLREREREQCHYHRKIEVNLFTCSFFQLNCQLQLPRGKTCNARHIDQRRRCSAGNSDGPTRPTNVAGCCTTRIDCTFKLLLMMMMSLRCDAPRGDFIHRIQNAHCQLHLQGSLESLKTFLKSSPGQFLARILEDTFAIF